MARRVVSSSANEDLREATPKARKHGRVVSSGMAAGADANEPQRSQRVGRAGSAKRGKRERSNAAHTPKQGRKPRAVASSNAGAKRNSLNFSGSERSIDVRKLESEDYVAQTLSQTAGPVGVAARPKVVDFNARLKERRQAGRRTMLLRVAAVLACAAVVVAAVWFFLFSPVFRLDKQGISVSGQNAWVSRDDVMHIAQRQSGKSLFLVSSKDITKELNNIPGVTRSTVAKHFPRQMKVTVRAQEPAAMLKTPDSRLTAVDGKGRQLNSVSGAPAAGIPVIDVDDVNKALNDRAVQQAVTILDGLPRTMRQRVSKVIAKTQDSVTCELDNGNYTVVWGDASQLKLKQADVDKIVNDPNVIGDKHQIDVSAPLRPIIK